MAIPVEGDYRARIRGRQLGGRVAQVSFPRHGARQGNLIKMQRREMGRSAVTDQLRLALSISRLPPLPATATILHNAPY